MTNSVQVYTQGTGTSSTEAFIPFFSDINPSTSDINFPVGKRWINYVSKVEFILKNTYSDNGVVLANWIEFSSGVSSTETLSGNSGGPVAVDSNNNIAVEGDATSINIVGNPSTHTLTANVILPATANAVLYSEVSSIGGVAPGTAGQILTCQGPSSPPTWEDASAGATQTLTPDEGGVVNPVANNIDVTSYVYGTSASKGIKTFNGGAGILQISNLLGVTPYVVGADVNIYHYNTIQDAINAADLDAPSPTNPHIVYVTPGTYTENLLLKENIFVVGLTSGESQSVIVAGNVTTGTGNGNFCIKNITIQGAGVPVTIITTGTLDFLIDNCLISAAASPADCIFFSGTSLTLTIKNSKIVNTSPTNGCLNQISGTLNVYDSILQTTNSPGSNFQAGIANFYRCNIEDSFVVQTTSLSIYDCVCNSLANTFISSNSPSNAIYNTIITCNDPSGFYFSNAGSASLSYGNIIALGTAKEIDNTTTLAAQSIQIGNISFDGGQTINNVDGGLWIGSTTGEVKPAILTAGSGISITNAANSITIASSAVGFGWEAKATSFSASAGNGYLVTATSVGTLPTTPNNGDTISFISSIATGSGTITITPAAADTISVSTVVGTLGGTAVSTAYGDSLTLVYVASTTTWYATSVIGNWTIN